MACWGQRAKTWDETRITSYFTAGDGKYRLCYTPRGVAKYVSIQLNCSPEGMAPFVRRIVQLGKYSRIKIYVNKRYAPIEEISISSFTENIRADGYAVSAAEPAATCSSQGEGYMLLCTVEKDQ